MNLLIFHELFFHHFIYTYNHDTLSMKPPLFCLSPALNKYYSPFRIAYQLKPDLYRMPFFKHQQDVVIGKKFQFYRYAFQHAVKAKTVCRVHNTPDPNCKLTHKHRRRFQRHWPLAKHSFSDINSNTHQVFNNFNRDHTFSRDQTPFFRYPSPLTYFRNTHLKH